LNFLVAPCTEIRRLIGVSMVTGPLKVGVLLLVGAGAAMMICVAQLFVVVVEKER
jgi:hypothetical protein